MKNNFEFSITFKLEIESMNLKDASLQMRKHVDEIHYMTGSHDFDIDLQTIKNAQHELIYTKEIKFYPHGTNLVSE